MKFKEFQFKILKYLKSGPFWEALTSFFKMYQKGFSLKNSLSFQINYKLFRKKVLKKKETRYR